ncbi:MAG: zinc metallopeptidase [Firmicutes bacterium]|nr:zinc metallopeptidase [Bacillota bacterium]
MVFLPDATWILILPALLFAMWAQGRVRWAYQRFSRVPSRAGLTGAQVARRILDSAGLYDIPVEMTPGELTDHFDPRKKVVRLSPGVYQGSSLAALGIAAHETGHALQHDEGYFPLAFRNNIFPVAYLGSQLAFPLFFIGFIFSTGALAGLMDIGILLFCFAIIFQLVTLPVEFNASNRAMARLTSGGYLTTEEVGPTKQVLSAAALTYVAAVAVAVTQLLRLLILRGRRD